ncbi:hypothetical protein RYX36_007521 [Vicia faba]
MRNHQNSTELAIRISRSAKISSNSTNSNFRHYSPIITSSNIYQFTTSITNLELKKFTQAFYQIFDPQKYTSRIHITIIASILQFSSQININNSLPIQET